MARRKKPTNQHKKDGTFQPCRHAGDHVEVVEIQSSPIPLTDDEQGYFDRISEMLFRQNLTTELDAIGIALMAQSLVDYVHHREQARGEGSIAVSEKGGEYLSGRHNAMAAAFKRLVQLQSKFGMTPVDRTGLECGEREGDDPFEELFKRSQN